MLALLGSRTMDIGLEDKNSALLLVSGGVNRSELLALRCSNVLTVVLSVRIAINRRYCCFFFLYGAVL